MTDVCRNRPELGHSWYTTARRRQDNITFCWACGLGWQPDDGLLTDEEMGPPIKSDWLKTVAIGWTDREVPQ